MLEGCTGGTENPLTADSAGLCGGDGEDAATFIDSISRPEDVDLFFVYCTAAEKGDDAGLHDPRLCDVPSIFGVFGSDPLNGRGAAHGMGCDRPRSDAWEHRVYQCARQEYGRARQRRLLGRLCLR